MGDADKELKIKITTAADNSGTKQAKQGLDDLSEATKKYIKALEAQDEKDKKSNKTRDETRRTIREIGAELPGLGEGLRLLMSPITGGFVLLASGFNSLWAGIKQLGDRATPEFQGLTEAVKDQKAAMDELDQAAETYNRALDRIATTAETVSARSKAALDVINSKGRNESDAADKSHDRDAALLEEAEKLGLITHEQYLARRLALDEAYAKKRADIERNLAVAREAEKYREYQNLYAESNALGAGLAVKRAAASKAAGAARFRGDAGKTDEQNLQAALDKIRDLEKEQADLHEKTTGLGAFTTMTPQFVLEQQKKQNDIEMAAQMDIADKLRRKIAGDTSATSAATDAANASKEDLSADEARLKANRERMRALEIELPRDDAQRTADEQHRRETGSIESQTRAAKFVAGLGPDALDQAGAAAEAMNKGLAVDAGQKAMVESLSLLLGTTHSNGMEILQIIKAGHQGQEGLKREIDELRRAVSQLDGRPNPPISTALGTGY